MLGHVVSCVLGDFHAAELGSTHRAEVRDLRSFCRQGIVVEGERRFKIQSQIELVPPTKFKTYL